MASCVWSFPSFTISLLPFLSPALYPPCLCSLGCRVHLGCRVPPPASTPMLGAAVFFGCCAAFSSPPHIRSAAPVFRAPPHTEGGKGFEVESPSDISSFQVKPGIQLAAQFHTFLPHVEKHLQRAELVLLEHLGHRFRSARLFILPASVRALCIINHQNRGLDVICCCVTFNNCKIKM